MGNEKISSFEELYQVIDYVYYRLGSETTPEDNPPPFPKTFSSPIHMDSFEHCGGRFQKFLALLGSHALEVESFRIKVNFSTNRVLVEVWAVTNKNEEVQVAHFWNDVNSPTKVGIMDKSINHLSSLNITKPTKKLTKPTLETKEMEQTKQVKKPADMTTEELIDAVLWWADSTVEACITGLPINTNSGWGLMLEAVNRSAEVLIPSLYRNLNIEVFSITPSDYRLDKIITEAGWRRYLDLARVGEELAVYFTLKPDGILVTLHGANIMPDYMKVGFNGEVFVEIGDVWKSIKETTLNPSQSQYVEKPIHVIIGNRQTGKTTKLIKHFLESEAPAKIFIARNGAVLDTIKRRIVAAHLAEAFLQSKLEGIDESFIKGINFCRVLQNLNKKDTLTLSAAIDPVITSVAVENFLSTHKFAWHFVNGYEVSVPSIEVDREQVAVFCDDVETHHLKELVRTLQESYGYKNIFVSLA